MLTPTLFPRGKEENSHPLLFLKVDPRGEEEPFPRFLPHGDRGGNAAPIPRR